MLTTNKNTLEMAKKLPSLSDKDLIYLNYFLNIEFKKRLAGKEVEE